MVSHGEGRDALAKFDDDSGTFVAHHHRNGGVPVTLADMQIGMADAGGSDFDAHFTCFGGGKIDVGHGNSGIGIAEDYCLHGSFSFTFGHAKSAPRI